MGHQRKIAVIGLGYVGLPVAVAFARSRRAGRSASTSIASAIAELRAGIDRTREVEPVGPRASDAGLCLRSGGIGDSRFLHRHRADADRRRAPARSRRHAVAPRRRSGGRSSAAISSSTNRPSIPAPSKKTACRFWSSASGLRCGRDFTVGYSPERINPGDKEHRFETITKVVSAQDAHTLDIVADVYGSVVKAGIHRAPSIKVAEAAKVIENTQRDLNIAFMNELSAMFERSASIPATCWPPRRPNGIS